MSDPWVATAARKLRGTLIEAAQDLLRHDNPLARDPVNVPARTRPWLPLWVRPSTMDLT